VKFVHDKGIAHRDLKLENCFLDKNINMKLADFGLAKVFAGPNGSALQTECGTPQYMAPEISNGSYDGPPVDIFALGVILFIMCNAKFPFGKAGDKYYNKYHKSPEEAMAARNISCNSDLLDLIRGMTLADPS
jgi:serine/threonine protein kinase